MSLFNKIFGGGPSEKQPKNQSTAKPKEDPIEVKIFKIETACNTVASRINELEDE